MVKTVFLFGLLSCCARVEAEVEVVVEPIIPAKITDAFPEGWKHEMGNGCTGPAEHPYVWRGAGYGSNVNFLLMDWMDSRINGNGDVAIIANTEQLFNRTTCEEASDGRETRPGWPCIFSEMPHLCYFDNEQDWIDYNEQYGVHSKPLLESKKGSTRFIWDDMRAVFPKFGLSGNDEIMHLFAGLFDYLHSHLQPWFTADVQAIRDEPEIAYLTKRKYVGMHIRRTDKLVYDGAGKAKLIPTETYFENAVTYLAEKPDGLTAADIDGVWLSTDDETVYDEAKKLAPKYFVNVKPERVVFVTARVPVALLGVGAGSFRTGAVDRNTYEAVVLLRAELLMLAEADVFSGTLTSNIGRVVLLMRHTLKKPRESTVSADAPTWHPGRRHL